MTVLTLAQPARDTDWRWVQAAPFRALARRLLADTGLPWRALAGEAGIPDRVLHHLVHGRNGRRLRRIAPHYARRLLRLDAAELTAALEELTSAQPSYAAAHLLMGSHWPVGRIAAVAELTEAETEALLLGRVDRVPRRVQVLLSTAVRAHRLAPDPAGPVRIGQSDLAAA